MGPSKILLIATSHNKLGDTELNTGAWLEEIAAPYYIFKEAGFDCILASPAGGNIPIDPKSISIIVATTITKRFLKDQQAIDFIGSSLSLNLVNENEFEAVLIIGGHGCFWDLENNKDCNHILQFFIDNNKPIGAIGQGIVSLLSLTNEKNEAYIKGKKITCYSNKEEISSGYQNKIPFLLESKLVLNGAIYS